MVPCPPTRLPAVGEGHTGLTAAARTLALLLCAAAATIALGTVAAPASAAVLPSVVTEPVTPVEAITPITPASGTGAASGTGKTGKSGTGGKSADTTNPLDAVSGTDALSNPLSLVLLLGTLSVLPAVLIMVTAFTRIVIVLGFTRSALGTQGVPPTQVLIGLAIFLTMFVMGPVFKEVNDTAVQPFLDKKISTTQAYDRGIEPLRDFMLKQVRDKDLQLFVDLSGKDNPATPDDVPTTTLIPAFVISELRTAFLIGFMVFIPFVVIDLVVSAALSAMGMAMLPPSLISLPFKLLLFVAVDGWYLLVSSLVRSFA